MRKLTLTVAVIVAVAFAAPLFAGGVGNFCDGKFIFKMNIIGVEKGKNPPMNNISRKTIFVALGKGGSTPTDIFLTQGPFAVCDGNGFDAARDCSGNIIKNSGNNLIGAVFQLPCNLNVVTDFTCSGYSACYEIWYRALGTPGGKVTITTCGLLSDGTRVCSNENTGVISRNHGTPTFTDVTTPLSRLVACVDSVCTRYPLFNTAFQDWLWQYDNNGLRNGMVVFCGADCS